MRRPPPAAPSTTPPAPSPARALAELLAATAAAALLAGCAGAPTAPATSAAARAAATPSTPTLLSTVMVKVLAINDFHGNLKPPLGGIRVRDPADPAKTINVPAGGAEHLATAVAEFSAQNPNHVFVAAGDLIGATPLLSALFRDEPTVEAMGAMGLEITAVGNHEFDKGAAELLRMQNGGCHPSDGCKGPHAFAGAKYQYLAASTVVDATGKTLLPPYAIKRFDGVPVAFIGLALRETPTIVVPAGVAGLTFKDEADTVNALVPQLKADGINAVVVLIHEGGIPSGDYDECPGISGPIVGIVKKLDPAVGLVVSGHTHRAYNCRIDGRLVTSGDKYGTIVTQIDMALDRASGRITGATAENVIVRPERFAANPALTQLIGEYETLAVPLARRVVGRIGGALSRDANAAGETPLGRVIADAQLAATQDAGAQIALMNPGGIRSAIAMPADGLVRYEDLFSAQPFYNNLVTLTLTGAQLLQLLEQQWDRQPDKGRVLQVSSGFGYTWDAARPPGARVVTDSLRLNGRPIAPDASVRVTVNAFMASGGDNFVALRQGREQRTGMMDVDALELFVRNNPTVAPGGPGRIQRLN